MTAISEQHFELLEKLCNASAVSGDEGEVRKIILEAVTPLADTVKVDALRKRAGHQTGQRAEIACG